MHGLVQTSLNNGIMKLGEKEFTVVTSVRSSVDSEKRTLLTKIKTLTEVLGGTVEVTGDYPGWTCGCGVWYSVAETARPGLHFPGARYEGHSHDGRKTEYFFHKAGVGVCVQGTGAEVKRK